MPVVPGRDPRTGQLSIPLSRSGFTGGSGMYRLRLAVTPCDGPVRQVPARQAGASRLRATITGAETTRSAAGPEMGGELMSAVKAAALCSARWTILTSRAPV
ncbi:hypothetical protein GCM10009551_016320 [Nocardiopsis tropica]